MRKLKVGLGLLIAAVMLVGTMGVGWGIPSGLINMQGRLTNNPTDGTQPTPITGPTNCRFSLFTGPTGGSLIWTELQDVTPDSNGIFNVTLGTRYSLDNISVVDDNYYLEIQLESTPGVWETLNRRQRLVAVPFAITAKNVRGGNVEASSIGSGPSVKGANTATSTVTGDRSGIEGTSDNGYGVWAKGKKGGVMGFNNAFTIDHTGTYGLLGGPPLLAPGMARMIGTYKYGAYGQTDANNYGYLGFSEQVGTGTPTKYGVYGASDGTATTASPAFGAGVRGENTFSGSIPTGRTSAVGVYGESNYGVGILGRITNTLNFNPAVKGISSYGHGTYGPLGYAAGVYGENTAAAGGGPGVRGVSTSGDGVRGETSAASGIVGDSGHGVVGKNTATSSGGIGVKGTSVSGIGVLGSSGSGTLPGVKAQNTNSTTRGGPALEIGQGGIKIPSRTIPITSWAAAPAITEVTLNAVAGSIFFPNISAGQDKGIRLYNNYITANSLIFFGGKNARCTVWGNQDAGYVDILIIPVSGAGGTGRVDFLILDPYTPIATMIITPATP